MAESVLVELEAIGPRVVAVRGHVDEEVLVRRLPTERTVEVGGARIGMVHDAGPARGRLQRMRGRFPGADAVVFGHSHIPLHEAWDGFRIFNPGSPTDRRGQRRHTMGVARVEGGAVAFELIVLD